MPPLIVPPPDFLDQSFPRSLLQLQNIAIGLGEMQRLEQLSEFEFLVTDTMCQFLEEFDWSESDRHPLLLEILRFLNHLIDHSAQTSNITKLCNEVKGHEPHELPEGVSNHGLAEYWCDEMGKLFSLHQLKQSDKFFIGVACSSAFAGGAIGRYLTQRTNTFPLVSPQTINQLDDAYEWNVPENFAQRQVSVSDARKNITVLGAEQIKNPSGGSHFKCIFPGNRPWILDPNVDPVPHQFLRELVPITNYSTDVIKYALLEGTLPSRRFKLN